MPHIGSTSRGSQYNGPNDAARAEAVAASAKAAQNALMLRSPRLTNQPAPPSAYNGINTQPRNSFCKRVGCSIMGGRRKTRRTKTRRNRH